MTTRKTSAPTAAPSDRAQAQPVPQNPRAFAATIEDLFALAGDALSETIHDSGVLSALLHGIQGDPGVSVLQDLLQSLHDRAQHLHGIAQESRPEKVAAWLSSAGVDLHLELAGAAKAMTVFLQRRHLHGQNSLLLEGLARAGDVTRTRARRHMVEYLDLTGGSQPGGAP